MDGFFLVSSLWLIAVTAEINSLAMAGHWNRERQKHKNFFGGFPNASPSLPRCTGSSAGTEYSSSKALSAIYCFVYSHVRIPKASAQHWNPSLGLVWSVANPAGWREALLGKSAAPSLLQSSFWCCRKQKRTRYYFCWGGKATKSFESVLLRALTEMKSYRFCCGFPVNF